MHNFIKDFRPTPVNIAKVAGLIVLALLVLAFVLQIFAPSLPVTLAPSMPSRDDYASGGAGYGATMGYDGDYAKYEESMTYPGASLSTRNVASSPLPPTYPQSSGNDAEKYEVTQYNASIETRRLEETCNEFAELKAKEYVVFENANAYDRGCSYTFKVERAHVEEVLGWLRAMNPKHLNENTYTIQSQVEDFTSEEEILKKKLAEIDRTLASATAAYDEVTRLATQTRDASSLASIISSRLDIIQRLTQERLNINEQLDRLARAKEQSLDGLEYTRFYVDVTENKFIDGKQLGESWKQAVRDLVRVVNEAIQGVTINLIALFFLLLQWALYALILLVIAKYGWQIAKRIWHS